jgi:hypothetical protein
MTGQAPQVSVIMATWGRGRHILPSVQSVLRQAMADFELLVVGDATADETEAVVRGLGDPRVRWLNLPERVGSQSGPNNAGITAARGEIIAYLGHDDLWEPEHLARLAALFSSADPPDFAVSGAIFHLPNGIAGAQVTGIFPDGADVQPYFFPPSSFAHWKAVIDRIGPWRMPLEIRPPVDEDLLLRATAAGLRFRATGVVTVHKFAAGHRYLSYVAPESREQTEMLARLGKPEQQDLIAGIVAAAKAGGSFMTGWHRNFDAYEPGEFARKSRQVKGLAAPPPQPLRTRTTLAHPEESALFDWEETLEQGFRQPKVNPRPRLLLPVTGGQARLRFPVMQRQVRSLGPIRLLCNEEIVVAKPRWVLRHRGVCRATYRATIRLHALRSSVLELLLTEAQLPGPTSPGLLIGPLTLAPTGARVMP